MQKHTSDQQARAHRGIRRSAEVHDIALTQDKRLPKQLIVASGLMVTEAV